MFVKNNNLPTLETLLSTTLDKVETKMKHVLNAAPGEQIFFTYDFGDDWQIRVVLEAVIEDMSLPGKELPGS